MSRAPVLVLQMQRMGDLVLSFPLLAKLAEAWPGHPLWVVGEERFFKPLLPLSPRATYFRYDNAPVPGPGVFHAVINLSLRPEAASLAGRARTDHLIGPWLDAEGRLFIRGNWQLYRASLICNNRYNRYHWADLNVLDLLPHARALREDWLPPRPLASVSGGKGGRVGLFLGASEAEKHPDAPFWAGLADALLKAGHKPALLGGEAERPLGRATAALLGAPHLDLTGRFSVAALARFIGELDLLITPDTGPMHIASGLGTPVLNLSMGPVNPWETGPSPPGHHVLRPALSCAGCWNCTRESPLCRDRFSPTQAASIAARMFSTGLSSPGLSAECRGLELLRTARDEQGLYRLDSLLPAGRRDAPEKAARCGSGGPLSAGQEERLEVLARPALSRFWQVWFGALFGLFPGETRDRAWQELRTAHPHVAEALSAAAASFALDFAASFRASPAAVLASPHFWKRAAPLVHPLSGYIQMYVQNELGSRPAFAQALSLAERIADLGSVSR